MKKIIRVVSFLCLVSITILFTNNAYAELISYGFESELYSQADGKKGNGEFFIHNESAGTGTYITSIVVYWGDNIKIATTPTAPAIDESAKFTTPGHGGQMYANTAVQLGYVGYAISSDGMTITINFNNFEPGETAAMNMLIEEIVENKWGTGVGGYDYNNANLKVYFAGEGGITPPMLNSYFEIRNANDKKIYTPSVTGSYNTNTVPIPPTVFLLGAGILGLVGIRMKRTK